MASQIRSIPAPDARREPVSKTIGSVTFDDPYAWLGGDSAEALAWQWQQNDVAEREARGWRGFEKLKSQIASSGSAMEAFTRSAPRCVAGRWFWLAPGRKSSMRTLWTSTSATDAGQPVFEIETEATSVFWYEPSPNADLVAVAIGPQSMESGEWRVVEVATGTLLSARTPADRKSVV